MDVGYQRRRSPADIAKVGGRDITNKITVSHAFGEIIWLASKATQFAQTPASDLPGLFLPAIEKKQFWIARLDGAPVCAALWAFVSDDVDAAIDAEIRAGRRVRLDSSAWTTGSVCWLMTVLAPFSDSGNHQIDIMIADVITGPLRGVAVKTAEFGNPREPTQIPADAADRLVETLRSLVSGENDARTH